jgi:predicted outer membrane lipoprotein
MRKMQIPKSEAIEMIFGYAWSKIAEQIKSIAFIILYLVVFQSIILDVPLANALSTAGGIALAVFGLAFFLEGLVLGLMPLGERVGVKLPTKVGILIIAIFGLVLGFGATLAEPAISSLRTAGSSIKAWESPLLYMLLDGYTDWLILSVGIGVGIAVALGMFRFYYNWSIKPLIYLIIPLVLILSVVAHFDDNLRNVIGLAWDCGAVTTGAVTVPLVLALGIGVSRAANKGKGTTGGFGIILLASAFPILAVLILSVVLNSQAPKPTSEEVFFSIENRQQAEKVFINTEKLKTHAFTHATEKGRISYFGDDKAYREFLVNFGTDVSLIQQTLGNMPFQHWLTNIASEKERNLFANSVQHTNEKRAASIKQVFKEELAGGIRAVVPLTLLLLVVLLIFLRERIRYKDEVALGIVFCLMGMILLTSGIRLGLASLGGEVGSQLPRAFAKEDKFLDRIVLSNFDTALIFKGISTDGVQKSYFNLIQDDEVERIEFDKSRYDSENQKYEYIIAQKPLFGEKLTILGLILVLLFAFGMGYGATLAEPALSALGMTVEGITVGTIKRNHIVQVVSIGVGLGIVIGLARILFDIPLIWLIVVPYIVLIPLTLVSEEEFTAIAWDSGGVTTGPVTVPLVLAMGLGIGSELNITDGFGILALASAFPIITTLLYGLYVRAKQKRSINTKLNGDTNGQ